MADLRFTWDAAKARANLSKHGISFEEAERCSRTTTRSSCLILIIPIRKSASFSSG
jgi:hypothetical protein